MSPYILESGVDLAELVGDQPSEPFPHLWTCLSEHAINNGNRTAIKSFHQPIDRDDGAHNRPARIVSWTYNQLYCSAECLAARIYDSGIRKGDSIVVFFNNRAEWVLLFWTSVRLDAVFVPVNPRVIQSREEVRHVLRVTKPRILAVIDKSDARALENNAADLAIDVPIRVVLQSTSGGLGTGWKTMGSLVSIPARAEGTISGEKGSMPSAVNDLDQTLMVLFTSGTTSLPKASISSYQNLLASVFAYTAFRHLNNECKLLQHLPVFHSWSINTTWAFWISAATVVFPSRNFDAKSSLSAIGSEHCTHMPAVPSMIQALITHPSLSATKLESLQSIDLAGTMILPSIIESCMDELEAPYSSVLYGMTEACFVCASDMHGMPYARHDIPKILPCGTAMPGGRLRVCKPGSSEVLKRGEIGELHMGGLQVTGGYLDRASDDFYQEDGINWLATGDQARIDGDLVYVLGRYKDLIIRGGENLSPAAIEGCLDSIAGIKDSQVVGIPDEVAGEVPVAVVRKSSALDLSDAQIQQKVSSELGMMFSPRYILELKDLGLADYPQTTSGKVKRGELKAAVGQRLSQHSHRERNEIQLASTIDTLIKLWAQVSGRTVDDISPDERADSFSDSIMMMQLCNLVGKHLGKAIAVEDLVGNVTIAKQARFIDTRPTTERSNAEASRPGPPTAADMVHVDGDVDAASQCQQKVESMLRPYGLQWDDVEDVIPIGQTVANMTRRTRLRNWNRRHAYHVPNVTTADLRWAVITCLKLHPTFRSMILDHGEAQPLYVVLRPHERWYHLAISEGHDVEDPENLSTVYFDWDSVDYAIPPGPLFKAILVNIRKTDAAGLIVSCHHSTFDALSMSTFFEDLDTALRTRQPPTPHVDFKRFADRKYQYLNSPNADTAVAFHVRRLQGYTKHRAALWPPQRAAQFFRGSDSQWTHVDGSQGQPCERRVLDSSPLGVAGINGSVNLPSLGDLKSMHGITASIVFKAALALLNVHYTGVSQVFFGAAEAARVWPTPEGDPDAALPNAMDIPGPTFESAVNRIHIDREQPLLDWLKELQEEQSLLTKYAQAPFQRIESALAVSDPDTISEHELHDSFFRRQCFNWLPPAHRSFTRLREVQSLSRADIGLQWNFMYVDAGKGEVRVNAAYDDCQMRAREVREAVGEVMDAARWIVEAEWEGVKVGECPLLGRDRGCEHLRGNEMGWAVE